MSLTAAFRARRGDVELEVDLTVPPGTVLALVGPNGAGKSTTLEVVAGLIRPDQGRVCLGSTTLVDTSAGAWIPPDRRRVSVVFQDLLLFPHLDVADNVAFGLRTGGLRRRPARQQAMTILAAAGIEHLAARRPNELSGGEAQRVALARAMAPAPDALLLDEPLAALDAAARSEVRRALRDQLARFDGPTLLVTHDALDAFTLADRIALLEGGRVTQQGTVTEVSTAPRTTYAAALFGVSLLVGRCVDRTVRVGETRVVTAAVPPEGPVLVVIRPDSVALHRREPDTSARNRWACRVERLERVGGRIRVILSGPFDLMAEVTPAAVAELRLEVGEAVWASVKATEVSVHRGV